MSTIEINPQFEQVLDFVNRTNQLIFLTGKAGTGKTTLLKHIRRNTFKQMAVVAPTGVAAINAGGSTIHSFFQFPFAPFLPALGERGELDPARNPMTLRYNSQRLAIFRNLELLVIDEVSMVRADLIDQIDITLRQTRKKWHLPFGGVQVLLIGDMYQLPPVVQQEEWKLLEEVYPSVYFFDSVVMRKHPPVYIELEKIYRQSEQTFIELLNKVRNNQLDMSSLDLLNAHYKPEITAADYRENITLTTHNRKADEINTRNLDELPGKSARFRARVEGTFSEKNYPADEALVLKKGTRVMFLKNNTEKNYYNGKIGMVTDIAEDRIMVRCDEDRHEIEVPRETWTNVTYKVDKATRHIDEEIIGTFNQYPLRLAWAITIHKSQGLTFDRLIIDAADSFSAGQVYVALSRCRSLKGLILSSRIGRHSLLSDGNIQNFASTRPDHEQVRNIFLSSQRTFIRTLLSGLFDLSEEIRNRQDLGGLLQMYKTRLSPEGLEWADGFGTRMDALNHVAARFQNQLAALIDQAPDLETDEALQMRLKQASVYFETELKICLSELKDCRLRTESKEAATELNELLQQLFDSLFRKHALIRTLATGFVFSDFVREKLRLVYPEFRINVYASARNTKVSADVLYPELFRELMLQRDEICNEEQKPIYMVANNKTLTELVNYLPDTPEDLLKISGFGEAKVHAYGESFLAIIRRFMREHGLVSRTGELKPEKKKKTKKEKDTEEAPKKLSTREQTYLLFRQGIRLEEIARQRGIALSTVQSHLVPYITSGELIIDDLVSRERQDLILKALERFNYEDGLNPVKSQLPADISFAEIRYVMAHRLKD